MNDTDVQATNTDYKPKLHKHYKLCFKSDWLITMLFLCWSRNMSHLVKPGSASVCALVLGFSKTLSEGYLYTPVGGDAWLSLWVNHWLFHSSDLKSLDSFNNETPSTVLRCLSSGAVIDTVSVCTSNVIHSWILPFETVVVSEAIDLMFQTTRI